MHYFSLDENEDALKDIIKSHLDIAADPDQKASENVKPITQQVFKRIQEKKKK
jgi:hypothetical protein